MDRVRFLKITVNITTLPLSHLERCHLPWCLNLPEMNDYDLHLQGQALVSLEWWVSGCARLCCVLLCVQNYCYYRLKIKCCRILDDDHGGTRLARLSRYNILGIRWSFVLKVGHNRFGLSENCGARTYLSMVLCETDPWICSNVSPAPPYCSCIGLSQYSHSQAQYVLSYTKSWIITLLFSVF